MNAWIEFPLVCFCSRWWLEPCVAMPPKARSRSHTPPTRGFWDRERERVARDIERERVAREQEQELREQDAMYLENPETLDWWIRTRETSAMAAHLAPNAPMDIIPSIP